MVGMMMPWMLRQVTKDVKAADKKYLSKLPKDVRVSLNTVYPEKVRLSIQTLKSHAKALQTRNDDLHKLFRDAEAAVANLRLSILQGALPENATYGSYQGVTNKPHSYDVFFSMKGAIPKKLERKVNAYMSGHDAHKSTDLAKFENTHKKECAEIGSLLMKHFGLSQAPHWDKFGWETYNCNEKLTMDITKHKGYRKALRNKDKLEAAKKQATQDLEDFYKTVPPVVWYC